MAELSRIDINGVNYYLLDENTKNELLALQQKVPTAATSSNQLADKNFVNNADAAKLDKITEAQFDAIFD